MSSSPQASRYDFCEGCDELPTEDTDLNTWYIAYDDEGVHTFSLCPTCWARVASEFLARIAMGVPEEEDDDDE